MNNPKNKPQGVFTALRLPLTVAVSSLLLAACSSTGSNTTTGKQNTTTTASSNASNTTASRTTASTPTGVILDDETLAILEDLLEARDMTMVEGDRMQVERYGNLWDRVRRGYRLSQPAYNDRIEAQKNWFVNRQSYLDRLTARSSRYLHHTVTEAERRGIPTELALLPIIESSYDPSATSNAAAAGLWQFIPSTGRIYGLNQTSNYDGRRDVIESTRAAYDFLTSLYNQFGSWELALAAYNAGPGRVQRAIDANRAAGLPTDYWSLRLPTETMNYVPRFMAVAQIIGSPSQYGVSFPAIANHTHFRTVPVSYGVSLYDVSSVTGVSMDELQLLNPALSNLRVDSAGPNRIVIPNSVATSLDARLTGLSGYGNSLPTNAADLASYASANSYSITAPVQTTAYIAPDTAVITSASSASELQATGTLPTTAAQVTANKTIIQEPPLSVEERAFIAEQIRANAQLPVEPINPNDGNIQLDA
ncbi:MAG: transglycosylase SLT domain-containing protein, partial [Moraxella sp.]|nr:transglycosylase SLT domain-containing protein [Moraxella sp.]